MVAGQQQSSWSDCLLAECVREPHCHGANRKGGLLLILRAMAIGKCQSINAFIKAMGQINQLVGTWRDLDVLVAAVCREETLLCRPVAGDDDSSI